MCVTCPADSLNIASIGCLSIAFFSRGFTVSSRHSRSSIHVACTTGTQMCRDTPTYTVQKSAHQCVGTHLHTACATVGTQMCRDTPTYCATVGTPMCRDTPTCCATVDSPMCRDPPTQCGQHINQSPQNNKKCKNPNYITKTESVFCVFLKKKFGTRVIMKYIITNISVHEPTEVFMRIALPCRNCCIVLYCHAVRHAFHLLFLPTIG